MPRQTPIQSDFLPYHVVARANNRERWPLPLETLWEIMVRELLVLSWVYEVEIQAFVLMPNHFHLILTTPVRVIGDAMLSLMKTVSRTANLKTGRTGHFFEGPYKATLINSGNYYANAYKYVYRNPVKAGLCDRVEQYPFSTVTGMVGKIPLPFPLFYTRSGAGLSFVPRDHLPLLNWLNQPHSKEQDLAIRKALRRKQFKLPLVRNTRRRLVIDETFDAGLLPKGTASLFTA